MKCSEAKRLISDYIDGNLSAKQSLQLKKHMQSCSDCQEFLKDFQSIAKQAKELETLSPSEDLWLKIKSKLTVAQEKLKAPLSEERGLLSHLFLQPKIKFAFSFLLIFIVIIAGVYFGVRYWRGEESKGREELQRYALVHLAKAEEHYQEAIKALNQAISSQKIELDPMVAEVFRKNLAIIDSSIKACRQALMKQPNSLELRSYLLAVYKEKVALLNELMEQKTKAL